MTAKPSKGGAIASLIGAAVLATLPFTAAREGFVAKSRPDPVGYQTGCFGDRQVNGDQVYTRSQCMDRLRTRLAQDYAPKILACVPQFSLPGKIPAFAAAIDAAYNAGPDAVCKSPAAVAFRAGQWAKGCAAFKGWYVTARGVRLPGLVARREGEAASCLKAAA